MSQVEDVTSTWETGKTWYVRYMRKLIVTVTTDTQAVTYTDNNTVTVVIYTVSLIGHINPTGYYDYIKATT